MNTLAIPTVAQSANLPGLGQQLLKAVDERDINSAHELLQRGADLETRGTNGLTPLMMAAEHGDMDMVRLLLDAGANAKAKDEQGEIALTQAARVGFTDVVKLLVKRSGIKGKNQALFGAVEGGPVVIQLADAGGYNPAPVLESPWVSTVKILLAQGAELEARRDENGDTPLIAAAAFAETDVVALLLQRGADINATDNAGNTALMSAACECAVATMNSAYDVVKVLLKKGADVNARSTDGATALINAAAGFGDVSIVKLLLDHGADPAAKDNRGNTALASAQKSQRPDKVRVLKYALARSAKHRTGPNLP